MSYVDASLALGEREAFLKEVRAHLPAFLSSDAAEVVDPIADVGELLNLSGGDLRRVTAVHLGLSDPIRSFVAGLRDGLRRPLTSSERPRVAGQSVRGPIDWGATVRHRAAAGGNPSLFVVRPAERVFDTPENRALVWLVGELDRTLRRIASAESDDASGLFNKGWLAEIARTRSSLQAARRFHWLRGMEPERPDRWTMSSLGATRTRFYKVLLPEAIRQFRRLTEDPTPEDLTELLCQRYFEPARDWQLFEIVVALRLARAIASASVGKRANRLLVGSGPGAYARYRMADGDEVSLWYQSWPPSTGVSFYREARDRYHIRAGSTRPDLVVLRRRGGATIDAVLLELKASRNAGTLGAGLMQLLGYLKDRPYGFVSRPGGWLVAPESPAFVSKDPGGSELWAIDADKVSAAVLKRFTEPRT